MDMSLQVGLWGIRKSVSVVVVALLVLSSLLVALPPVFAAPTATIISRAPESAGQGQGGIVVASIDINNVGGAADILTTIKLHSTGSALTGSDIAAVRIWKDTNVDGVPQGTELIATLAGVQTGETYAFTSLSVPIAANAHTYILVTVDLASNAVVGRTVQLSFTDPSYGDVVLSTAGPIAQTGSTSAMTISTTPAGMLTAVGYTGKDTQTANAPLVLGATVGLSIVKLSAVGAAVNVTKIKVTATVGSGTVEDIIGAVKIYLDDGSFDPSTNPKGGFGDEVAGTWSAWSPTTPAPTKTTELTISGGLVISAGSSKVLHVAATILPTATTGVTVTAYIASSAGAWTDITAKSPGSIVVAGATPTVYAGLTSTSGTLAVTVGDSDDISSTPVAGRPTYAAMKLTLTPSGEPMEVKSINVTLDQIGGNTFVPADILRVRAFEAKSDGSINKTAEIPTVQGTWSGVGADASTTLTLSKVISKQTVIHIAVDIATTATSGHRLKLKIAAAGDIVTKGQLSQQDISSTGTGSTSTSPALVTAGTLAVTLDTSIPAPNTFATIGATKIKAVKLRFDATTSAEDVRVEKIKLTLPSVVGVTGVPADIAAIKLYNGTLTAAGELQYEIPTVAGSWEGTNYPYRIELTIQGGYTILKGTSKDIYVGVNLKPTATVGKTYKFGIDDATHITAKGVWSGATITPTLTNNYPANVFTVEGKLTVAGVSQVAAGASVSQGQTQVDMLKLTFTASGETMTINQIVVTLTGLCTAADISSVKLYEDSAGALGTQIASTTVSGSTATFTGLSIEVAGGTSKIIHVAYDIAGSAVAGHTVGAEITSDTSITATGATSTDSNIHPSDFTKISSNLATITTGATLSYASGTLKPLWTTANKTAATFTLNVTKGGAPGITLDPTKTCITITDGFVVFTAYLTAQTTIPAGDTGTTQFTLTFSGNMPNIREDLTGYTVTLRLQGTDTNNAPYDSGAIRLPADKIKVDNTPPTITHTPVTQANANTPITITATVTDPGGSGLDRATLYYRTTGATWSSTPMFQIGANTYSATIPAAVVTAPGVEYYILATDVAGASRTTSTYTVTVILPDTTPPTITHTPVTTAAVNTPVTIRATVTDNVAVQSVTLYYRTVGAPAFTSLAMAAEGNVYSATIPATAVTTAGVEYYIVALDTSNNQARAPTTGTYTIQVTTFTAPASTPTRVHPVTGAPLPAQVSAGSSVGASTTVTNLAAEERTVRIFFVVEKEGVPLLYGSATVRLAAAQSFDAMQGWILVEPGTYTIRITVTDAATGVSLSEEQTVTYTVVG